ncbi:MAG: hypothetical protein AB7I37_06490 [Pirellulales bacterium]
MRIAVAQGVITASAFRKAQEAGPDGLAKFVIRLNEALLTPLEIEALNDLGMTEYLPFFMQAMILIPACRLLDVAELPSVLQVV